LKGEDLKARRGEKPGRVIRLPKRGIEEMARQVTPLLPVDQRRRNFKEVKTGFSEDTMMLEARRCMTCGSRAIIKYVEDCMLCDYCEIDCPENAIYVSPAKYMPVALSWG
ncbi:unnamed protein product, partial [marine sediment metagenome]